VTPADGEGLLDEQALAAHVDWLAGCGVDGVLVAGTTGEGPLLDDDEVIAAVAAAAEAAAGRLQVVAHVGRPSTRATIRLAREAQAAGATSIAAVVPYFFAFGEDQLLAHFSELAAAVPSLPVVAYTIPVRTHHEVPAALFERMLEAGVAGIKDSTKSEERHAEYLEVAARHAGARVYMGSDGLALLALRSGATGLMSAVANAMPDRVIALRDAVAQEAWDSATSLQDEMLAFRTQIKQGPDFVALKGEVAQRLAAGGHTYPTGVRRPLGLSA
jgi:4-hydroxy-tetrahydrodipicolinate synthase/2-dehydro-3-deoxy-phosphogluconate/2-dehydro-3-deoxy-6-phosphogalactonate aldolase